MVFSCGPSTRFSLAGCVLAASAASSTDLARARSKVPRSQYRASASELSSKLNEHLVRSFPAATPCEDWSVAELQALQWRLWQVRSPELMSIYTETNDRRSMQEDPQPRWLAANREVQMHPDLLQMQQHAHCREVVLWLVHLLDSRAHREFRGEAVPMLPHGSHGPCLSSETPVLCAHSRASHVCSDCHVGAEEEPYVPTPTEDGQQPDWPAELPDPVTMTVHKYEDGLGLIDMFHVDYRFKHSQQHFTHELWHAGCETLIEGNDWSAPSGVWAWATLPDGTVNCIKGFSNVTLFSTNFVRRSGIPFSKAGRYNLSVPGEGDVDTWAWCRLDDAECFYEAVSPRQWVSWQFRQHSQLPNESSREYYSNITVHEDLGPFQLPKECPSRDAAPVFDENTYPNLGKVCEAILPEFKKQSPISV